MKHNEFKKYLAEKYGVEGNPKFERCFELAYDYGHSAGFEEVENYFMDLVDLIQ